MKNVGSADRLIRVGFALAIGVTYATNMISGTTAIVLGGIAAALLATSLFATCPGYMPFGISTRHRGS